MVENNWPTPDEWAADMQRRVRPTVPPRGTTYGRGQAVYPPFRDEAFNMAPNQSLGLQPAPKAKRSRAGTIGIVIAILGLMCGLGSILIAVGAQQDHSSDQTEAAAPAGSTTVRHAAAQPKPTGVPGQHGDGTYAVGREIAAGQYTTDAGRSAGGGVGCYWARLKDDTGTLADVIANGIVPAGGHGRVRVAQGDKFIEFTGGCTWKLGS